MTAAAAPTRGAAPGTGMAAGRLLRRTPAGAHLAADCGAAGTAVRGGPSRLVTVPVDDPPAERASLPRARTVRRGPGFLRLGVHP